VLLLLEYQVGKSKLVILIQILLFFGILLNFLYNGNIEQLISKKTGSVLQADALYVKRKQ
jgi:hypothetical protein